MIHAALRACTDPADAAAATGLDPEEVVHRWLRWAQVQTSLVIGGCPPLDADQVRAIATRPGLEVIS
jgi:hypothetical protein